MLLHLKIENYALIDKLDIDLSDGFSIITGETGAGKSILLGALSLILGQRSDTQVLFDKSRKCFIEGTFYVKGYGLDNFFEDNELDYDDKTILRREINQHGKSRAFINDTPVTLNLLKELGDKLVDIHSQHQTLTLNDSGFQLAVIDNYAQHAELIKQYKKEYTAFTRLQSELNGLTAKERQSKVDKDYYQFQFDELEQANLISGEQDEIEKELEILNNSEDIKKNLYQASHSLINDEHNLVSRLAEINSLISNLADYHPDIKAIGERLNSSHIELLDIAKEIERIEQQITYNPERIEQINERLNIIYQLQQKHHVSTIDELLIIKQKISDKLFTISSLDETIAKLANQLARQRKTLQEKAGKISANRLKVIPAIEKEVVNVLSQLAMPDAQIKVNHTVVNDFTPDGIDKVVFMFTANKGIDMKELSKVASGGELSRLMLSIKSLVSERNLLPTIIFDEIDIGISGDTASKVGNILKSMSGRMQLIAITHLPQIAGKGDTHYLVYKQTDGSTTKSAIKKLTKEERTREIAKMLSGEKLSKAATQTAKELLEN